MQYVIAGLTVLLVVSGVLAALAVFDGAASTPDYADAAAYDAAVARGDLPRSAPPLPPCAREITLTASARQIEEVSFVCTDRAALDAYARERAAHFEWNYYEYESGRVSLERAR